MDDIDNKEHSEEEELEYIKNIIYGEDYNDDFVERYIKSEKALKLYEKLKKAHEIIK
jgi:hypothetical protein